MPMVAAWSKRIKLPSKSYLLKLLSRIAFVGAMFIALSAANARAAELVMFEQAGCVWCEAFHREIAPVYGKTDEGRRAPLRRVDIAGPVPPELAFIDIEKLTPLFVMVDNGREIGRIRGYPGEDNFWGLLGVLIKKLDTPGGDRVRLEPTKALHASN
jgi:hypothetical protein